MRRLLLCAVLAMVALTAAPLAIGSTKVSSQRETSLEQGILREVNRVRVAHGLRPLSVSRGLQASATYQSRILLEQGVFDHDSAAGGAFGDRLRRFYPATGARAWSVGENLLWSTVGIDPVTVVNSWLNSPPHRRIMLDPTWKEFGVGALSTQAAPGMFASVGPVVMITLDFGVRTTTSRTPASASR